MYCEGGLLPELKDGEGWFKLPNSLVDLHFDLLGSRGVALYVLLARQPTRYHYPGIEDLATSLKAPPARVKELLFRLYKAGLVNDSDVRNVVGVDGVS